MSTLICGSIAYDSIMVFEGRFAASVDDVKEFFRRYYAPNNAVLSIVGDVDPAQARAEAVGEAVRRMPSTFLDYGVA